jgi:hypothetical protein
VHRLGRDRLIPFCADVRRLCRGGRSPCHAGVRRPLPRPPTPLVELRTLPLLVSLKPWRRRRPAHCPRRDLSLPLSPYRCYAGNPSSRSPPLVCRAGQGMGQLSPIARHQPNGPVGPPCRPDTKKAIGPHRAGPNRARAGQPVWNSNTPAFLILGSFCFTFYVLGRPHIPALVRA